VELDCLLLFEGTKEAVCCHSSIRLGTAKKAKMQFSKCCSEFWSSALCNSAPKSSETREQAQKTQPQKFLRTWSMLCTGRTDVKEVSHAFLSLLYFEKPQAEAEHEFGSGAATNIPNHVLGREHQKKRAGT
jgi:hypothetical protein